MTKPTHLKHNKGALPTSLSHTHTGSHRAVNLLFAQLMQIDGEQC